MPVDFAVEDGIALITINRPERMNALDAEHYRLLSEAWITVRDDSGHPRRGHHRRGRSRLYGWRRPQILRDRSRRICRRCG